MSICIVLAQALGIAFVEQISAGTAPGHPGRRHQHGLADRACPRARRCIRLGCFQQALQSLQAGGMAAASRAASQDLLDDGGMNGIAKGAPCTAVMPCR